MPKQIKKPHYRSSYIRYYFTCPKSYQLATRFDIPQNDAMKNGLLFEGYVFGFKSPEIEKAAIGKRRPATIEEIKRKAGLIKPIFKNGQTYVKLTAEKKEYKFSGEIDYVGAIEYEGTRIKKCLADLKFTGDVERKWNNLESKDDVVQSVMYSYLWWKNYKERLPFIYVVVENKYDVPLIKLIEIVVTDENFKWLEDKIFEVHNDLFYYPRPDYTTCLKDWRRCPVLEHCKEGRNFLANPVKIEFDKLN